jgi:Transglutaminase-like superfamily
VDLALYATPGPMTTLMPAHTEMVRALDLDPVGLCRLAKGLVIAPMDAYGAGLDEQRMAERNTRPAGALLQRVLDLDDAPFDRPRGANGRIVGTCRHFAVLATAFLRACDVASRARCGFAGYFVPDKFVDHWVVEHWSDDDRRWVRIDPEYLGRETPGIARVDDLRPGEFLTAGEAWQLIRSGHEDGMAFGVFGTENWGPGEIRGNAMRDLASIARTIELLPWDEWGPMEASYEGRTGDDFDQLMDELAEASRTDDDDELQRIYSLLAVPEALIR